MKALRLLLFTLLALPLTAAQQTINVGATANDGTGDPLRTAGGKINANFTELYTGLATSAGLRGLLGDETGAGAAVFATSPTLVTPALGVATATSLNGLTLTGGSNTFTLTLGTASLTVPAGLSGTLGNAAFGTLGTTVQAYDADLDDLADGSLTGSKVGSGIAAGNITSGTLAIANGGTGAATATAARTNLAAAPLGEVLAADFVTTIASQFPEEAIFTPVPVTSGKTYHVEGFFWLKWATAAASGPAAFQDCALFGGLLTYSDSRVEIRAGGTVSSTGFGSGELATLAESTSWQRVSLSGWFTASSSADFSIGLLVPAWDAGDVVTVRKGATLIVRQID